MNEIEEFFYCRYPSIPIPKALELIECLLKCKRNFKEITTLSVQSIMKLLKWIFALTYCGYGGKHFVFECGPIGLSVTVEVAIIYMEDFQMRAKQMNYRNSTIGRGTWTTAC